MWVGHGGEGACAVPQGAWFGMNLNSGLQEAPHVFDVVSPSKHRTRAGQPAPPAEAPGGPRA
jgi:hypothetical protein